MITIRRGRLTCPPKRVASEQPIHSSIQFIYGDHDLMARGGCVSAERYFREGMLALPYRWLSLI